MQTEKESVNERIKAVQDEHAEAVKAHHFNFERKEKEFEDHIQQLKDKTEELIQKALEQQRKENEKLLEEQGKVRKTFEVALEEQRRELERVKEELEDGRKSENLKMGQAHREMMDVQEREKEAQNNLIALKKEIQTVRDDYSALEAVKNTFFEALKTEKKKEEAVHAASRDNRDRASRGRCAAGRSPR